MDFTYYIFEVGEDGYKPETDKLVWNVIANYDGKIQPINLFEYNWVFLKEGLLYAKENYENDFDKFSKHIRDWLRYEYWSRSQYEVMVSNFGGMECEYKLDVYTQVMINWDRFIEYVWNNKHLIS